jgi:hypothetical protein
MTILSLKNPSGYPENTGSKLAIPSDGEKVRKQAKWTCER